MEGNCHWARAPSWEEEMLITVRGPLHRRGIEISSLHIPEKRQWRWTVHWDLGYSGLNIYIYILPYLRLVIKVWLKTRCHRILHAFMYLRSCFKVELGVFESGQKRFEVLTFQKSIFSPKNTVVWYQTRQREKNKVMTCFPIFKEEFWLQVESSCLLLI